MTCKITKSDCVAQGDSYELLFGVKDITDLSSDWTCYLQVRVASTGEATAISRYVTNLTTANDRFTTILTTSETSLLTPRKYIVGAQLTNTVTGQSGEVLMELEVTKNWVTPA